MKGEKNESISNRGSRFYWLTHCRFIAIVAAILIAGLVYAETAVNREIDSFCQGPGSDFDCISGFCFVTELSPQLSRCLYHPGIGNNDFFTVLMIEVLPIITPGLSVKSFVHEFQQYYDGQAPVYVEKFYRPGFMYNSGIAGIELSQEKLAAVIASEKKSTGNCPRQFKINSVYLLCKRIKFF